MRVRIRVHGSLAPITTICIGRSSTWGLVGHDQHSAAIVENLDRQAGPIQEPHHQAKNLSLLDAAAEFRDDEDASEVASATGISTRRQARKSSCLPGLRWREKTTRPVTATREGGWVMF